MRDTLEISLLLLLPVSSDMEKDCNSFFLRNGVISETTQGCVRPMHRPFPVALDDHNKSQTHNKPTPYSAAGCTAIMNDPNSPGQRTNMLNGRPPFVVEANCKRRREKRV